MRADWSNWKRRQDGNGAVIIGTRTESASTCFVNRHSCGAAEVMAEQRALPLYLRLYSVTVIATERLVRLVSA